MPNARATQRTMRRSVGIAANHGQTRLCETLFGSDDMHNSLTHIEQFDIGESEFPGILLEKLDLDPGLLILDALGPALGRHVMIGNQQLGVRHPHPTAILPQTVKRLGACDFMDDLAIDIKNAGPVIPLVDEMSLPDLGRTVFSARPCFPSPVSVLTQPSSALRIRRLRVIFATSDGRLLWPIIDLFRDTGPFSAAFAQIVKLGPPYRAAPRHLDFLNARAVERKHPFNAFTIRNLAHREGRIQSLAGPRDNHTFINLNAFAIAFNHTEMDPDGVTRRKLGDRPLGLKAGDFFPLDLLNQVHDTLPFLARKTARTDPRDPAFFAE